MSRAGGLLAPLLVALAMSGCVVTPAVSGYEVEYVEQPPVVVDEAPRVYFEGEWAYYVDGHWYSRRGGRWSRFLGVPPHFESHRHRHPGPPPHHPEDHR